jgi:ABC-2 type transport system permease protein
MTAPILGMRLIAEERRNRTMTLLLSAPVSMTQIVLGKYIGLCAFLLLPVALASAMGLALRAGGRVDLGLLGANALGLTLLLATFAAVALFASTLTRQPLIAAIVALGILLASWLASLGNPDSAQLVQWLSVTRRFEAFNSGIIDSANLVWHAVAIVLFLLLAIRRLDRDRLVGQSA